MQARLKWSLIAANVGYGEDWDTYIDVHLTGALLHDLAAAAAHRNTRNGFSKLNTEADRDSFPIGVDVMVQNAYYFPNFNSINMLAGLMMEPLFGSRLPDLMNLAAYGFVIGHEITHGFDNSGRLYNGTGFFVDWWTNASTTNFNQRAQCLIDQYNSFPVETSHVDGQLTLGENLADLGGLGLAWAVYKGSDSQLPQLIPQVTNDQLFWVNAGQVWCSVSTPAQAMWQIANDVHSPGKYRIIGPMSNIKGFADAFNCPANSFMGRSKTDKACSVW